MTNRTYTGGLNDQHSPSKYMTKIDKQNILAKKTIKKFINNNLDLELINEKPVLRYSPIENA